LWWEGGERGRESKKGDWGVWVQRETEGERERREIDKKERRGDRGRKRSMHVLTIKYTHGCIGMFLSLLHPRLFTRLQQSRA
jgi:hypothetical protein